MFGEAFDEPSTYQGAVPGEAYLQRLLSKPHFVALAAMEGDDVVGGLAAYVLEKFERERSEVYIYDLAVAAAHRRRGIGTGLIRALEPIARAKGAYVIFVQADAADAPAVKLYESLGVKGGGLPLRHLRRVSHLTSSCDGPDLLFARASPATCFRSSTSTPTA